MRGVILFFFLVGVLLGLSYYIFFRQKITQTIHLSKSPTSQFSIDDPPKNSLKGTVSDMSGDVSWESRLATAPAKIDVLKLIQQGEAVKTGDDGKLTIDFAGLAMINIPDKSSISFVQTLPENFVFQQEDGNIVYEKLGTTPITVRSFHMITSLDEGSMSVKFDSKNNLVEIDVSKGQATVGYEDVDNISRVIKIKSGQKFLFDDASLTGDFIGG